MFNFYNAGNSVRSTPEAKNNKVIQTLTIEESSSTLSAVEQLDEFLEQLVVSSFLL